MPIYEFECGDCGHEFEEIRPMSDPDADACPSCDSEEVGRLVSESSFHLKGGGWFDDGYSTSDGAGATNDASSDSETSSGDEADDGGSDDHQPAAE